MPACNDAYSFVYDVFSLFRLVASSFSYVVVLESLIVRKVLIWLAMKIRFKNLTQETNWIMLTIFSLNIFNYGFVYLLAPWDSRDSSKFV